MTLPGYVLSDLHLFTDRSNAEVYGEQINELCHQASFLVLNGDIFDFQWSRFASTRETIAGAIDWLDRLCARNPDCHIHYIMGNHDGLTSFAAALEKGFGRSNFFWSPTHARIGTSLFLHGDLPLKGQNPFHRELIPDASPRGERLNALYTHVVNFRVHRLADLANRKRGSVKRICTALQQHPHADLDGVTDIYFGHTHVSFEDFRYGGYTFHNTGAAIRGVRKRIIRIKS